MQKKLIALAVSQPPYGIAPRREIILAMMLRQAFDAIDRHLGEA